jgi:hypothetical protein
MTFVLLPTVFPLQFAALNLSARHRDNARCQLFESLERRFFSSRLFFWHADNRSA